MESADNVPWGRGLKMGWRLLTACHGVEAQDIRMESADDISWGRGSKLGWRLLPMFHGVEAQHIRWSLLRTFRDDIP